jgi:3-hydroxyisobutyrate dehydrogenase-like beta-hydroxyacid dehydrogenase
MLVSGNYAAQFTAGQMVKDLDLILGCGHSDQVPMQLVSAVRESFGIALAQGHGNEDFFILFEQHKRLANA